MPLTKPSLVGKVSRHAAFTTVVCGASLIILAAQASEASYTCEDGVRLSATFNGGSASAGTATLVFANGAALTLTQALSADGGRYVNGTTEFWIKGRGATLTRNGKATTCRSAG